MVFMEDYMPLSVLDGPEYKDPPSKTKKGGSKSSKKGGCGSSHLGDKDAGRENTGRWTSEEHVLFLKGLELHGKGWKKIAKLIKSRTVVQIRTHAQKYFQKLAKARKNGQHTDLLLEGRFGKRFKHGKRRGAVYGSYLVSVEGGQGPGISPMLKPFITALKGEDMLEKGLYRFLTPLVMDPSAGGLDTSQVDVVHIQEDLGLKTENEPGEPLPVLAKITADLYVKCMVPEWFKRGQDLDALLKEAGSLDWLSDNGGDERYGSLGVPSAMSALVNRMGLTSAELGKLAQEEVKARQHMPGPPPQQGPAPAPPAGALEAGAGLEQEQGPDTSGAATGDKPGGAGADRLMLDFSDIPLGPAGGFKAGFGELDLVHTAGEGEGHFFIEAHHHEELLLLGHEEDVDTEGGITF